MEGVKGQDLDEDLSKGVQLQGEIIRRIIPNSSLEWALSFSIRQEEMTSPDIFTLQDHHFTTCT